MDFAAAAVVEFSFALRVEDKCVSAGPIRTSGTNQPPLSLEVGRGGGGAFSVPRPLYPSSFTWLVAWFLKTVTSDNLESFAGWQRRTSLRERERGGQNDVSKLRLENRQVRQGRQRRRVRRPANT